jgi:integrase
MPAKKAPLTDARCRGIKPAPNKALKVFDGGGFFLEVRPTGAKLWRLKYRFFGKEKLLALGSYPDRSLADARVAATEAKRLVASGVDPSAKRKTDRLLRHVAIANTLEGVGREWHEKFSPTWVASHSSKVLIRLEKNVFPWLGARPISEVEPCEILAVLRRMEERGILDTARRVRQYLGSIYRYAITTGRARHDVSADLKGAVPAPTRNHYATMTDPVQIGALLRAIDCYEGSMVTRTALALAPMLFCRPGELRGMEWSELDLEKSIWKLPPARQKLKKAGKLSNKTGDHSVPLSTQAVRLLRELQPLTGSSDFVFPSERVRTRSMSDGTVNAALRRLGFSKEQITGHGFRHMASTLLNEQGWSADAIECQLSHNDGDLIRGTYNRAKYLPERQKMMQAWADYLDLLKARIQPLLHT